MRYIPAVVLLILVFCGTLYAETSRNFNLMVNGGIAFTDSSDRNLFKDKKNAMYEVAYLQRLHKYFGFNILGGYTGRNEDGVWDVPVRNKAKYEYSTIYAGAGVTFFFPLTYIDLYASGDVLYNMNKLKIKTDIEGTILNKDKNYIGYLVNAGVIYYYGNLSMGIKYQYNYNEYEAKLDIGSKTYRLNTHSVMAGIGLSF